MTSTTVPDDVLWHIFSQNVPEYPVVRRIPVYRSLLFNDVTPNFLTTARSSSQVCRDWRRVMLSASNIWSKVFDFEELSRYSQPALWLNAIIERSGSRGLTLYGQANSSESLNGFLQLIQLCWHRIETVHVHLHASMKGLNHDFTRHPAWTTLNHTPSPTLQYLRLKLGSCGYLPRAGIPAYKPRYLMIDSKNPAIRHLFVEETSQFAYDVDAPILRNLRTLSLSGLNGDDFDDGKGSFPCSVEEFLTILRGAPLLESLNIDEAVLLDLSEPIPYQPHLRADLPNLKHIEIESNISECLGLLRHIVRNRACGLELRCHIHWESIGPVAQLEALYDLICDQFVRHRPFDKETWISFDACPEINVHSITECTEHFRFAVWPGDLDPEIPLNFIQLLLRPAFDFSSLPYVHLKFSNSKYAQDISPTDLFAFLNKLESLRILSIPWDDFNMFLDKIRLMPSSSNTRPSISGDGNTSKSIRLSPARRGQWREKVAIAGELAKVSRRQEPARRWAGMKGIR